MVFFMSTHFLHRLLLALSILYLPVLESWVEIGEEKKDRRCSFFHLMS